VPTCFLGLRRYVTMGESSGLEKTENGLSTQVLRSRCMVCFRSSFLKTNLLLNCSIFLRWIYLLISVTMCSLISLHKLQIASTHLIDSSELFTE
jgi:hypothetical protein